MKRVLIALMTTLPLVLGVSAAQAYGTGYTGGTGTWTPQVMVAGSVVSVDASAGTFVANAYVLTPPSMGIGTGGTGGFGGLGFGGFGGFGGTSGTGGLGGLGGLSSMSTARTSTSVAPTTTQVTITTNTSTMIIVSGVTPPATVGDLVPGAQFVALIPGSSSDPITTLVNSAATAVFSQLPKQFYAFVGTVQSTDTTAGTVTVDVTSSLPSGLISTGSTATFTVGSHTFIIGGSSLTTSDSLGSLFGGLFGGSLTNVATGDIVAGGLIGPAGLTATEVEASPLMFLLDLPAPTTGTSSSTTASAEKKALDETLKVLHGAKLKLKKSHSRSSHHKSKSHKDAGRR
jgi:hypothetical protein